MSVMARSARITSVGQLVTPRAAARLTRVPWAELRGLLEESGYRIYRLGARDRVAAVDIAEFIESCRQPTTVEASDRVALAIELVAREMGIPTRSRRQRRDRAGSMAANGRQAEHRVSERLLRDSSAEDGR